MWNNELMTQSSTILTKTRDSDDRGISRERDHWDHIHDLLLTLTATLMCRLNELLEDLNQCLQESFWFCHITFSDSALWLQMSFRLLAFSLLESALATVFATKTGFFMKKKLTLSLTRITAEKKKKWRESGEVLKRKTIKTGKATCNMRFACKFPGKRGSLHFDFSLKKEKMKTVKNSMIVHNHRGEG